MIGLGETAAASFIDESIGEGFEGRASAPVIFQHLAAFAL
jgi:hypothetical protein